MLIPITNGHSRMDGVDGSESARTSKTPILDQEGWKAHVLDGLKAKTPLRKRRIILQETCKNLHRLKRKQWKPTSSHLGIGNHRGI